MLSEEEIANLRSFRTILDSDDVRIKEIIKKKLLSNRYIAHVLNPEIDEDSIDDLFGVNILPYYTVDPTQTNVDNFICYETAYNELPKYNKTVKMQQIIFYILCHVRNANDKDAYVAKHDLLAALLLDQFDYTNYFGPKIKCVSNVPRIVDNTYVERTLVFEQQTDTNLVKTIEGVPRLANKQRGLSITDESIRNKSKSI